MEHAPNNRAYVNMALIALNAVVFLYLEITGSPENVLFMYQKGALTAEAVLEGGEFYRLFTAMFMHFGISHLINNMIILFALGDTLERALGHVKYLVFYLACGICSNFVSILLENREILIVSAGASGAIFGVVGGLLYAVMANKGKLENLSALRLAVMAVLSLYLGFTDQGIDNAAHIAGLVFGFLFCPALYRKPKSRDNMPRAGTPL